MPVAKLINFGGIQAVCLPLGFEFSGSEVQVSKSGDTVLLKPTSHDPRTLGDLIKTLEAAFPGPCDMERPPQPPLPPAPSLD